MFGIENKLVSQVWMESTRVRKCEECELSGNTKPLVLEILDGKWLDKSIVTVLCSPHEVFTLALLMFENPQNRKRIAGIMSLSQCGLVFSDRRKVVLIKDI